MMSRFLTLTTLLFLLNFCSQAQIVFQKSYGGSSFEYGHCVQQTTDGGYVIAGYTDSYGAGNEDIYIVKLTPSGDTTWTRTFGGAARDEAYYIEQTSDNGYILTGSSTSFNGVSDCFLLKIDVNGNLQWSRRVGSGSFEMARLVQQTTDGGYIIFGTTSHVWWGANNLYLAKADGNGNLQWAKAYGSQNIVVGYGGQQTTDGGYVIVGDVLGLGAGSHDVCLVKTDAAGDTLWARTYGNAGFQAGRCVKQTDDGGYVICGITSSPIFTDILLIKTNTAGDTVFTKNFHSTAGSSSADDVQQTSDGGYLISGSAGGATLFIKTNAVGDTMWTKTVGPPLGVDYLYSGKQTSDGGFIFTGTTQYTGGTYNFDMYVIKTDSTGSALCNPIPYGLNIISNVTTVKQFADDDSTLANVSSAITFAVSSGGAITTLCTTVGIEEALQSSSLTISPNPSGGIFNIEFQKQIESGSIAVYYITGQIVLEESIKQEKSKVINLIDIPGGVYFVKVVDGDKSYCRKLIVEHN